MQEIQFFADRLDRARELLPDIRRQALKAAGDELLSAVRGRIGGTGKVQRWQEMQMGSGGGYTAIRAKAKTYQVAKSGQRTAVGYITNAIESGHRVRRPASGSKRYRYRGRGVLTVPGKRMYAATAGDADRIAARTARDVEKRLTAALEG